MNKFESSPVVKEFQKQKASNLPKEKVFLIAGVSGGPDSMALLYLLHRFDIKTVAVHCNYQLRGEASDKDQELVEKMCALWGVECIAVRLDSPKTENGNFQAWARERRYQVFRDLMAEYKADYITTAHHEDDQLETILQRILRGAGTPAWKGMNILDDEIFRPLLGVEKSGVMKFVQDFNIPYRIDISNEESTYARNFLRHNWFPALNRFFPGWRENLLKIPHRAAEFEGMADEILSLVQVDEQTLNREKFLNLTPGIRDAVFYRFYEKSGIELPVSSGGLSEINHLEKLQTGKSIQLNNQVFVTRDRKRFILYENKETADETLTIFREQLEKELQTDSLILKTADELNAFEKETLNLDAGKVKFPISIRKWKDGDVIQPMGMTGTQLISDHLTNRKIKSTEKNLAKVIESFDGIICAVIFPHKLKDGQIGTLSELYKCTSDTSQILIIRKS